MQNQRSYEGLKDDQEDQSDIEKHSGENRETQIRENVQNENREAKKRVEGTNFQIIFGEIIRNAG